MNKNVYVFESWFKFYANADFLPSTRIFENKEDCQEHFKNFNIIWRDNE